MVDALLAHLGLTGWQAIATIIAGVAIGVAIELHCWEPIQICPGCVNEQCDCKCLGY